MVTEENQQSTTGRLASGYLKATGYTNMIGVVSSYIIGVLMILGGVALALLFGSFVPLIFSGLGLLIILLGRLGAKHSKKMREGQYYQMGKGWTEPQ